MSCRWAFFILAATCAAQPSLRFEVASVKVETDTGRLPIKTGGPGTSSPGKFFYPAVTLPVLLADAYSMHYDQIVGPEWLRREKYTIAANVPPGVTPAQFSQMLQNLIIDRFHLKFHIVRREYAVYELRVAPGGAKLTPSPPFDAGEHVKELGLEVIGKTPRLDPVGCPVIEPGYHAATGRLGDGNCTTFRRYTIQQLLIPLGLYVGMEIGANEPWMHIVDATNLKGEFDFNLNFVVRTPFHTNALGPSIFEALEKVGLKLENTKRELDTILIDSIDRVPVDN